MKATRAKRGGIPVCHFGVGAVLLGLAGVPAGGVEPRSRIAALQDATVTLGLDRQLLRDSGWDVVWRTPLEGNDSEIQSPVARSAIEFDLAEPRGVARLSVGVAGAAVFVRGQERWALREVSVKYERDDGWRVTAVEVGASQPIVLFRLDDVVLDASAEGPFLLRGTVVSAADGLRIAPEGDVLGVLSVTGRTAAVGAADRAEAIPFEPPAVPKRTASAIGPDVIVGDLHDASAHGASGGITALSIGTTSCNIGDAPLKWFPNNNQHPVIAQNLYRLKGGRFEQLGLSWLKHGFFALSEYKCFSTCQPTDGTYLGVHCSDPYSAYLNGQQGNLGPRYQVNAHTGVFPYPPANPPYSGVLPRRIQVPNTDLDPAANPGALYFAEGQYVTADDADWGHQNNNASFRPVTFFANGNFFSPNLAGSTRRQKAAIRAWRENDPFVVEADVQVPDDGLFIVAGKSIDLGGGNFEYEYAVQNLNSHRSALSFSVPIDPTGTVTNVGFHDVNYHSGEPFSPADWSWSTSNGSVTWTTEDYSVNQNANALRWGTLYNFRFRINRQPYNSSVTIGLFRPGTPGSMNAAMVGPITSQADCNDNGIPDSLDIQNQTSADCDGDLIPDECESFAVAAVAVAQGLDRPVYVTAPAGDARLFIVEQPGRIKILSGATVLPTPFLDITGLVSSTGERGLLSIAFSPNYGSNGLFYVYYTNLNGDTAIARYQVSGNPDVANPGGTILKTISQDLATHNGGQLQFGPDGFLYVGLGDGGGNYDPFGRAQDTASLLGKILRLDVNAPPTYVPESNPFFGAGLPLDEIWAIGTRNPWRFSFDRGTGDLYIADVGEGAREEINYQPAGSMGGQNYGWRCMEGSTCTGLSGCTCNSPPLTLPVFEYPHAGADCSVTGGYVYRGCAIPNLLGAYLYADYCSGKIGSFRVVGGVATDVVDLTEQVTSDTGPIPSIVSFGENREGEIFIVSHAGTVYRLLPDPDGGAVCGNNVLEPGEFCDDGNTDPGDGCDEYCAVETGPPNDRCTLAQAIGDGSYLFDTNGAGSDGPPDGGGCIASPDGVGSDVWYCYTAPRSGTATASSCIGDFNSVISVYEGCQCPTADSQIACNDNACGQVGTGSIVTFPTTACSSYMIRLGGSFGDQGAGELNVACTPPALVADCDGNGIEDTDDILCGSQHDSNGNLVPDTCETDGDYVRGGRLYDEWWIEAGVPDAPTHNHPLWANRPDQTSNSSTGAATWRCKECHGWDYKGVDGQYSSGPHRTGFAGVLGTTLDAESLFNLLKQAPLNGGRGGLANGHDYGSVLPDTRINDLVAFVLLGAVDDAPYIETAGGAFLGDAVAGESNYTSSPPPACIVCHGPEGTNINFGTPQYPEYLGTVANENPWELLHKVRFGQPGAPMPSWLANGGSTSGAADIGRYVQLEFPTECTQAQHCDDSVSCTLDSCDQAGRCAHAADDAACSDDGLFCTGPEVCDLAQGCTSAGNPCSDPSECVEATQECGCLAPTVVPAGNRYLAISPQPANGGFAMALVVAPQCGLGQPKYIGAPSGADNVAFLVDDPGEAAYLTPAQWGETVYVTGTDIAPAVEYGAYADCGLPGRPVVTAISLATMPTWGDVTGAPGGGVDGVANVLDISAVVDGVLEVAGALPLYVLDLYGCSPNQRVDVVDISGVVDAVRGLSYQSGSVCPGPCW